MMKLLIAISIFLFCSTLQSVHSDEVETRKWTEETEDGDINIEIFTEGEDCERTAQDGDILVLSYQGMMPVSGVEFDNSKNRKRPYHFTLGEGRVMKAWEIGLKGMCKGEKRSLTIPAGPLQKGDQGSGAMIPHDDETLAYVFELLAIRTTPPPVNMFKEMDTDGDNAIQKEEMRAWVANSDLEESRIDSVVEDFFKNLDKDEDNIIIESEFPYGNNDHDEL